MYIGQLKERDNYLETLKQQIKDLNCAKEANLKHIEELKMNSISLQEGINSLKEENCMYIEQLKERDNYLETLKQQIKDLNCAKEDVLKHIEELKMNRVSVEEEIYSLKEKNCMYIKELKEKDDCFETLNQQMKDLISAKEDSVGLQEEIKSLREENCVYIEQLKERDNHLETLNQQINDLNCSKEANLKHTEELKVNSASVEKEINSLKEKNFMYIKQIKEKDNCLETLNQQIKDVTCAKEANLKYIEELKMNSVSIEKERNSLREKNFMYIELLKEKDDCFVALNQQSEDAKEGNLKYTEELKMNNSSIQEEINYLRERNFMYIEQLKEGEICLRTLIKDLNCAKEASLNYIDDLEMSSISVQEELNSLIGKYCMYIEQLKEKDNCHEALNQQIKDLISAKEANLKHIKELKINSMRVQEEINSLKEKNSMYIEKLKEKDNCLEALNQQIKDLNCAKEASMKHNEELKMNSISAQEEIHFLKEENCMYNEQLKEKDICLEALNQQSKDLNCAKEGNFKYIDELKMKQLQEKYKCVESFGPEYIEQNQQHELAEQVVHYNKEPSCELGETIRSSLSDKSYEIESCRRMMLKEVRDLKPHYDVKSISQYRLTELLKMLLTFVMEKEKEIFHTLRQQIYEMHNQASEAEKEYADKDRRKDCWIRELETEVERLQSDIASKVEKKELEMDDKLYRLKILEKEKADLIRKVRQSDNDLAGIQLEMCHAKEDMKSHNKRLKDLQLLLEEKDSQLQKELDDRCSRLQEQKGLLKKISDLKESSAVLIDKLENRNNDNNLLLKKVEDLQYALVLEKEKTQDAMAKFNSVQLELKTLSFKYNTFEEDRIASKEIHSLLLKEKERCSELTLNLKKVSEDLENLTLQKLTWDSEKQHLEDKLATKEKELSLERNLLSRLKEEMSSVQEMKEENDELKVLYAQMLQTNEMLKNEIKHLHISRQAHNVNTSQKSETSVTEPAENLVLNKQLEERLEKQKELAKENESSSVSKKESSVESLHSGNEVRNVGVPGSMARDCRMEVSEEENLRGQLEICLEEKAALDDENEQLVSRIRGTENLLEICCVDYEEEIKRLVLELAVSNKKLLDAQSEIQELKLKTIAVRKAEASQEHSIVENLQIRNKLLQESQSASNNINGICVMNSRAELEEKVDVPKASVTTITDISGTVCDVFFTVYLKCLEQIGGCDRLLELH
jgi:hypothetical protein